LTCAGVCVSTNYPYKRQFSNQGFPNYCSYRMWRWDLMHWCINIIWLKTHWQWFLLVASLCIKITHIIKQQRTFFLPCALLSWLSRNFTDDDKHWIFSVWLATFLWEMCLIEDELNCKLFGKGSISSEVNESSVGKLKGSGGSMACEKSVTLSTIKSKK